MSFETIIEEGNILPIQSDSDCASACIEVMEAAWDAASRIISIAAITRISITYLGACNFKDGSKKPRIMCDTHMKGSAL